MSYEAPSIEHLRQFDTHHLRANKSLLLTLIIENLDLIEAGESNEYSDNDLAQWRLGIDNINLVLKERFETIDADSELSASESED